jgi:CheY-like chemotaxis protein
MREIYLQDVLNDDKAGYPRHSLAITHFPYVIGRDAGCDGRFTHPCISRRQCQILLQGDDVWIQDLESRNGTFVNNERLQAPRPLHDGDRIDFAVVVFRVCIPAEPSASVLTRLASPQELPAVQQRQRILVVEDNEDAAESLAMLLRYWGHEVSVARDGPQALSLAEESPPNTVLLDIRLPGMDGYQVAERLQEQGELSKARLVGLTGYQDEKDALRSREVGLQSLLTKPVDPMVLQEVITAG